MNSRPSSPSRVSLLAGGNFEVGCQFGDHPKLVLREALRRVELGELPFEDFKWVRRSPSCTGCASRLARNAIQPATRADRPGFLGRGHGRSLCAEERVWRYKYSRIHASVTWTNATRGSP